MSRRTRGIDYVEQTIYGPFRGMKNNPSRNRKLLYEEMYTRILTEFAMNRFKWSGMPNEIDTRFLELMLFRNALCVFYYDVEYDRYMALQGSGSGQWNMYQNPITFTVVGNTMHQRQLKAGKECVPIWSNMLRMPDWDIVILYASKLAEMETTIEISARAMRMPFVFAVDDNQKHTYYNVWRQIMEGQPAIFGTDALNGPGGGGINDAVQLLNTGINKDHLLTLQIAKAKMWNEAMTFLGINNSNQDKRERLVADEVAANDSQISIARNVAMKSREYACQQINKLYPDLHVSVAWDEELMPQMPSTDASSTSFDGGGDYGREMS